MFRVPISWFDSSHGKKKTHDSHEKNFMWLEGRFGAHCEVCWGLDDGAVFKSYRVSHYFQNVCSSSSTTMFFAAQCLLTI